MSAAGRGSGALDRFEVWFVTGSQTLYGEAALRQVAEHSAAGRRGARRRRRDPGARRPQAGADEARRRSARSAPRRTRTTLRRDRRLDAHVLAREDVDRRPGGAAEAAAPPAHAVQPRAAVGRDRHGLHEPEPVGARRPGVRLTCDAHAASRGRRSPGTGATRPSASGSAPGRARRAAGTRRTRCGSPASATTCATSRSPRATRSRRRSGSASRSTATASASSVDAVAGGLRRETVDALRRRLRASSTSWPPSCGPAVRGASRCATPPGSRRACARSSTSGGCMAFTDTFEDLHGLPQLPGIAAQRLMADGYGFGAEGDWKAAALVRILKVMATGLPGGTSFMEDYTYDLTPGRAEGARGAHARGLPVDRGGAAVVRDPPAVDRRPRRSRSGSSSPPRPGRRSSSAWSTSATGSASSRTRSTSSAARGRCRGCRSRARSGEPRPDFATAAEAWLVAGGSHHTVLHRRARPRGDRRPRRDRRHRARRRSTQTPACATSSGSCAGTRPTTGWHGALIGARRAARARSRGEPRDRRRRPRHPDLRQRERRRPRGGRDGDQAERRSLRRARRRRRWCVVDLESGDGVGGRASGRRRTRRRTSCSTGASPASAASSTRTRRSRPRGRRPAATCRASARRTPTTSAGRSPSRAR